MTIGNFVKTIQNIMRGDSGINGDAQRIEQMTWILFLKVYDAKEEDWEFHDDNYESIIPEELRWRNWAVDNKDGEALTGQGLLDFVNIRLFPALKELKINGKNADEEIHCQGGLRRQQPIHERRRTAQKGHQCHRRY